MSDSVQPAAEVSSEVSSEEDILEVSLTVDAAPAPAYDDSHDFVFTEYLQSHNLPTVYWDPAHTGPFIIFNKAKYAAKKYDAFALKDPGVFAAVEASAGNLQWASEFVAKHLIGTPASSSSQALSTWPRP